MVTNLEGKQLGRYTLRERIGEGGMSAVYVAYEPKLNRDVAVKVLASKLSSNEKALDRFKLEARTAATLEHNNIIPVYDYDVQDDYSYIVMRLMPGGTLGERIKRRKKEEMPFMSLGEAAELLSELAKALSYAHGRGVIHRDMKPSNIMFDGQGDPYVVDFGIARVLQNNPGLTNEYTTLGTPSYMSPEQWQGFPLSQAVDQYSLAVIMFEVVTGTLPYKADVVLELGQMHVNHAIPLAHTRRADLPPKVSDVIARGMAKGPGERYPDIAEMATAFREAVRDNEGTPTSFFTFPLRDPVIDSLALARAMTEPINPVNTTEDLPLAKPAAQADLPPVEPPTVVENPLDPPPTPNLYKQPPAQPKPTPRPAPVRPPAQVPQPNIPAKKPPRTPFEQFVIGGSIGLLVLSILAAIIIVLALAFSPLRGASPATTPISAAPTVAEGTSTSADDDLPTQPGPATADGTSVASAPTDLPITERASITGGPLTIGANTVLFSEPQTPVRAVAISNQGAVASGHGDGSIRLWREGTGAPPALLRGHTGPVMDLAFSPNGALLVSGGEDQTVRVWDAFTGQQRTLLTGHTASVRAVAATDDAAASASEDGTVRLWDTATNQLRQVLDDTDDRVLSVAFSPDGSTVAAGDELGNLYVWDATTGARQRVVNAHNESVRGLDYSPDGSRIVTSSTDNTARLWDASTYTRIATMPDHGRDVWRVVFSPTGEHIATGGRDETVRVWDGETGTPLNVMQGHEGWVLSVAFSPDGAVLASGGGDGAVRLWSME